MRIADATSKGSDVSRRETSSNEGESMTEACVITKDKDCVAYVIKEIATGMVLRWKRLGQVDNGRQRQYFLHTHSRDLGGCVREPTEGGVEEVNLVDAEAKFDIGMKVRKAVDRSKWSSPHSS